MISIFTRNNEHRVRKNILHAVYEENLHILGRGRQAASRQNSFTLRKILLFAVVCLFVVLMNGEYESTSFSPSDSTFDSPPEMPVDMGSYAPSPPAAGVPLEGTENVFKVGDFLQSGNLPLSRMFGLKIRTIMIDAGHGGANSGSIGKMGTKEKDITLDIAKRLKTYLVKIGHLRVLMTREDDSTVSLHKRVALTQDAKADLFISIHLNYLPRRPTNIIETYYFGPSDDEKTLKLAKEENAGSEYGLSDFKEVMERLGRTMKLQESREIAESIQENLFLNRRKHNEDIKNHGVKRAPFVVLLGVDVPAVLAEVSCLSNKEEERKLNSESHRDNIARYLTAGIFNYLNKGAKAYEAKN
jgi:N-acetylmuramoyl-L-alanine amidase